MCNFNMPRMKIARPACCQQSCRALWRVTSVISDCHFPDSCIQTCPQQMTKYPWNETALSACCQKRRRQYLSCAAATSSASWARCASIAATRSSVARDSRLVSLMLRSSSPRAFLRACSVMSGIFFMVAARPCVRIANQREWSQVCSRVCSTVPSILLQVTA